LETASLPNISTQKPFADVILVFCRSAGEGSCHFPAATGEVLPHLLPGHVGRCSWSERYIRFADWTCL